MDKLNRLKSALKSSVTKLENFILENVNKLDISSSELEVKLKKVDQLQTKLDDLRAQYYEIPPKENSTVEKDLDELENRLDELEVSLKTSYDTLKIKTNSLNISNESDNQIDLKSNVKLPEIPLPVFSGKYEEWSTFKMQFSNLISNNEQLNESQKLFYLRASLKNEAKQLETPDDSFASLFSALQDRFENKRLIVDTHLLSIINYEKIHHESPKELRSLIDCVNKNLRGLNVLKYERNDLSDAILINIILQKLDKESRKQFEFTLKTTEVPKFEDLITFLENRSATLENISRSPAAKTPVKNSPFPNKGKTLIVNTGDKQKIKSCVLCKNSHSLNKCFTFQNFDVQKRYEFIKEHKLCINCLNKNHVEKNCTTKYSCFICGKRHNTLLHRDEKNNRAKEVLQTGNVTAGKNSGRQETGSLVSNASNDAELKDNSLISFQTLNNISQKQKYILLSTVYAFIEDKNRKRIRIRCILDNGSNINILTNECANILGIKRQIINAPVSGLNGTTYNVKTKINAVISNAEESFHENVDFLVVPKITDLTPTVYLKTSDIKLPDLIELADPTYYKPGTIHALIGAELFFKILKHDTFQVSDTLFMQNSVFGWVATGSLKEFNSINNTYCYLIQDHESTDDNLKRFWDLESIGITYDEQKDAEEDKALEIFDRTTVFKNGRYEVQLPWKKDWRELRDNFNIARHRLRSLQQKLRFDLNLYTQYKDIVKDYLQQGIIEEVEHSSDLKPKNKAVFYLPHQAVCKHDRLTTKVRIVFDASSHEKDQLSLNDCLWQGPNLNPNLFDLLINFRLYKFALLADIEKAFLQISLAEADRDAVRFLWNDAIEGKNPQIFRFKRVLFGVNASPFLLSATIKRHIEKYRNQYPDVTKLLDFCLYVDDFITGADNLEYALEISRSAKQIMHLAGMTLRKWVTNDTDLMEHWKSERFDVQPICNSVSLGTNLTKVLGMAWNIKEDCLIMEVDSLLEFLSSKENTKRVILQAVGKIFDPLGLLTPFTIRMKCLLQELWTKKIAWDDNLPPGIETQWLQWCSELSKIAQLKIPRLILNSSKEENEDVIEIHSFCDASKRAYGAAIYLRVKKKSKIYVNLLTSKSRVAPLKKISLPRLELLAALLAARLTNKIKPIIGRKKSPELYYWSDSKITLYWIRGSTRKWKQFVANRVEEIKSLTNPSAWHHCPGKLNPADLVTRGIGSDTLLNSSMWWCGPSFLSSEDLLEIDENIDVQKEEYISELKNSKNLKDCRDSKVTLTLNSVPEFLDFIFQISNKYMKILYVLVYVFRFIKNCRTATGRKIGLPSFEELNLVKNFLVREVQRAEFEEDFNNIRNNFSVTPSSKIKNLSPFIDEAGIIRVGGRLNNSSFSFERKHPILLPAKNELTQIIIQYFHEKYLHSGPQALLYQIRQVYWPLNGRNLCRKVVHSCLICFKANPPQNYHQKMGVLPKERVNRDFVFNTVGIDLCGPFHLKNKGQRKGAFIKVYICLFVCFVTKAIHLEIISDLTSDCLIATLKRFISRRGKCARIFSDNATNFTGANKELKQFLKLLNKQDETLTKFSLEEQIEWKFIPPRAPNFGGLWEAGVKSCKYYLKRIVGNYVATYEEFLTIITQVEAMLNSRPLTPLSSDIDDLEVLTPAHFLIGRPLSSIAEPSLLHIEGNKLDLWQKATKSVQLIWKKWSNSYLNNLQQRTRWMFKKQNVEIGQMVLLKEDNLPPSKWIMGRVIKTYKGDDNMIRVVDVKTRTGVFKRTVSKLCVLPLDPNSNEKV